MTSRDPGRVPAPAAGAAGDAELLTALRTGDRAALGELYSRHRPRVAAYLARRMVCAGDVEDVVQDTFLRLWDGTEKFDPATHGFGAWLCGRVARWTLIDYGRRDRFRQGAALDIARDHARRHPTESAHQRETTPVSPRVVTALARLTPAQRRSVQLRYLDGYSTAAAAIVAESSPGAIATNSLAARERLRERGIEIDPSYAYAIRNHRRGGTAAPELDTARDAAAEPQRDVDTGRAADLGVGITARDAERVIDEPDLAEVVDIAVDGVELEEQLAAVAAAERVAEPADDVAGEREPSVGARVVEPADEDSAAAALERAETAVAGARREAAAVERQRVEREADAVDRAAQAEAQQRADAEREAQAGRARRDVAECDRLADPGPEPGRCAA